MTDQRKRPSKGQMRVPEPESNLIATFQNIDSARQAADKLRAAGFEPGRVHIDEDHDATVTSAAEQREERDDFAPGPVLMTTKPMLKGGFTGVAAGSMLFGGVGLMLAAVLVLTGAISVPVAALIVLAAIIAGSVAGGVFGGATRAQREQFADMTPEHRVGVRADPGEQMDRAEAILRQVGPARIDRFDRSQS